MTRRIFFITGTDTGVGKTVLTSLLTRQLRAAGVAVAALKPLGSGGREDGRALHAALGGRLSLDEVNPWHFRVPLTPLLAARRARREVHRAAVLAQVRRVSRRFSVVLVEGAGGLLSPLGEDFDARDLITALQAAPIVVGPNRLGAISQVSLVVAALPRRAARLARVVLMTPPRPDISSRSNAALLRELLGPARVHVLPRLNAAQRAGRRPVGRRVRRILAALLG